MVVREFALPDLGEGLTESELVAWRVDVGDTVTLNQTIAEVETAKALVELPSPFAGVVTRLFAEAGTTVQVGAPLIAFEVEGDAAPDTGLDTDVPSEGAPEPVEAENGDSAGTDTSGTGASGGDAAPDSEQPAAGGTPAREPVLVGYGPRVASGQRPQRKRSSRGGGAPAQALSTAASPADAPVSSDATMAEPRAATMPGDASASAQQAAYVTGERPRSTPPVRKLARDLGVDLAQVPGTGARGLVTREDVELAATGASAEPGRRVASVTGERETRIPIKGVRKHTAAAMVSSAFTAPHVSEFLTIDVTETMELIDSLKSTSAFRDVRLNLLSVVAKAVCIAVERTPEVNARWDEASGEMVQYHYVNLGIAAATPRGLMVPNIKDAQDLDLVEMASALGELVATAKKGASGPEELAGGTLSITNIGVFGIDAGTPILPPGEALILALGAVRRMPWEHRGEIALRDVITLSVSFDHRLVDGEQGSRFLADVGRILERPSHLLAMV